MIWMASRVCVHVSVLLGASVHFLILRCVNGHPSCWLWFFRFYLWLGSSSRFPPPFLCLSFSWLFSFSQAFLMRTSCNSHNARDLRTSLMFRAIFWITFNPPDRMICANFSAMCPMPPFIREILSSIHINIVDESLQLIHSSIMLQRFEISIEGNWPATPKYPRLEKYDFWPCDMRFFVRLHSCFWRKLRPFHNIRLLRIMSYFESLLPLYKWSIR